MKHVETTVLDRPPGDRIIGRLETIDGAGGESMSVNGVGPGRIGDHGEIPGGADAGHAPVAEQFQSALLQGHAGLEAVAHGDATIANGSKGDDVKALQKALMAAGYALPKYGADGGFGGEGIAAVKALQHDAKLPETG